MSGSTSPAVAASDFNIAITRSDATFAEDGGTVTFTVTTDQAVAGGFSVNLGYGGTAESSGYNGAETSLVFSDGDLSKSFTVTGVSDTRVEGNETIVVSLLSVTPVIPPAGAFILGGPVTSTITDDDSGATLTLTRNNATFAEDGGTVTFTVTTDRAVEGGFTVNLGYGGTAESSDYSGTVSSLVFGDTDLSKSFTVSGVPDTRVEGDETVVVSLASVTPANPPLGSFTLNGPATSTITDDDSGATLTLTRDNAAFAEDGGTVTFTVTTDRAVEGGFTVNLGYGGTAESSDYSGTVSSLVFGDTDLSKSFTVSGVADTRVEGDETIIVSLVSVTPANPPLGSFTLNGPATSTITDDDSGATLTLTRNNATFAEDGGTVTFTVTTDRAVEGGFTVNLGYGGTAEPSDRSGTVSSLVFGDTDLSKSFTVTGVSDTRVEGNETIEVSLSGVTPASPPLGAFTLGSSVTSTITDNDSGATLTLTRSTATFVEDSGAVTFTVTSNRAVEGGFTVNLGYGGTAESTDYSGAVSSLVFGDTDLSKSFTVAGVADTRVEGNETIVVSLAGVTPASPPLGTFTLGSSVTSTITDNDSGATLTLTRSTSTFAEDGGTVIFTVTSNRAVEGGFTVNLGYGGTAESTDYSGTVSSLSFGDTDLSKSFTVTGVTDTLVEGSETIIVSLASVTPASPPLGTFSLGGPATVTVTDNDTASITITRSDATFAEDGGTVTFTVATNRAVEGGFTVNLGYGGTAASGDYSGVVSSLIFSDTDLSKSFTVTGVTDTRVEGDETVVASLSSVVPSIPPLGAFTLGGAATSTIEDNDSATLSIAPAAKAEDGGTMVFTVISTSPIETTAGIGFSVGYTNGTATAGVDFGTTTTSGSVSGGASSVDLAVPLINDNLVEGNEDFTVTLSNVVGSAASRVSIGSGTATGTIEEDDKVVLSIDDVSVYEDAGVAVFTITSDRFVTSAVTINVGYATVDGTALFGVDYASATGTATITDGTSTTISVPLLSDTDKIEPDKTFTIQLSTPTSSPASLVDTPAKAVGVGTIVNDEYLIAVTEESPFGSITTTLSAVHDVDDPDSIIVSRGSSWTFDITAGPCPYSTLTTHNSKDHHISKLLVDGAAVTAAVGQTTYSYPFNNITTNHTIEVLFTSLVDFTSIGNGHIETTLGNVLSGTPNSLEVLANDSLVVKAVPDAGFYIKDVKIGNYSLTVDGDGNVILDSDGKAIPKLEESSVGTPENYTFEELLDTDVAYKVSFAINTFVIESVSTGKIIFLTPAEIKNSTENPPALPAQIVDYKGSRSFYVNLIDTKYAVYGILIDNISYPIPAAGTPVLYSDFTLSNVSNKYLEINFTNVIANHRLEVQDYDKTPLADAPLDAKLRPKPASLMFALDDSGSMDWEITTSASDGLYYDYYYVYSYPRQSPDPYGTARVYDDISLEKAGLQGRWKTQFFAANKMFYNPTVTYVPWPTFTGTPSSQLPAVASDGLAHANIYRPRLHPWHSSDCTTALSYTGNNPSVALSGCSNYQTFPMDDVFLSTGGITIYNAHYFTWDDTDKDGEVKYTDANSNEQLDIGETGNEETVTEPVYLVNLTPTGDIQYYKVLDNSKVASSSNLQLVTAALLPATVKTFAVPGSTGAWKKERQNWADWFSYYRKRTLTATGAVARVIDQMEDVEVGIHTINYDGTYGINQSVLPVDVAGKGDKTNTLLQLLYKFKVKAKGTPLRSGLLAVGQYYDDTDASNGGIGTSPYNAKEDGDECKQAFTILMTDGYYYITDVPEIDGKGIGNIDKDNGIPYKDDWENTLADVAMKYFENDLSSMENLVPDGIYNHQHMVTYTVAFGVHGSLNPADYDFNKNKYPAWPDPAQADAYKIDDMWHAAVNGRGKFMSASRPDELVNSLLDIMNDISTRVGSGASVSVNGDEMYESVSGQTRMFQTTYNSGDWHGDLQSFKVDTTTGEVVTNAPVWSAEEKLVTTLGTNGTGHINRKIATYNGSKGIPFRWDATTELTALQQKQLAPYFIESTTTPLTGKDVVNYLRGNKTSETSNTTYSTAYREFRSRGATHPLGDIINSLARYQDEVLYVGSNDGMLHAFRATDTGGGEELFAYVPNHAFRNLRELADPAYDHRYFVDNTPDTHTMGGTTLLVGGLGKGGKGYYCLDITGVLEDDTNKTSNITSEADLASRVKWEYPSLPTELLSGTTFTFTSGTLSDVIADSAKGFSAAKFKVGQRIAIVGANYANGVKSGTNDGEYTITKVAADGSSIEVEAGSLITGYGNNKSITITNASGDTGLGYSYSKPYFIETNDASINSGNSDLKGWVVIFGNGYSSEDGTASLYILNPITGELIRKIETNVGPFNGLSTPTAIDVNNDLRADYIYAGDLLGNMWKFDISSTNKADWQVAYCDNSDTTNHCKESVSGMIPKPLFAGLSNQPITSAPDVTRHKSKTGYMVVYGTGKYLGEPDLSSIDTQSLYGIWDWAPDALDNGYNGIRVDVGSTAPKTATLSNWPEEDANGYATHTLLRQVAWAEGAISEDTNGNNKLDTGEDIDGDNNLDTYSYYRIISNYTGDWSVEQTSKLAIKHHLYNKDINGDGKVDSDDVVPVANVGWVFDLPGKIDLVGDKQDNNKNNSVDEKGEHFLGERVTNDAIIRDGKAILVSFGVTGTRCNAGAYSFLNERDVNTGGMTSTAVYDLNRDGEVDAEDFVYFKAPYDVNGDGKVDESDVIAAFPSDEAHDGRLYNPAILRDSDSSEQKPEEKKYFSTSQGSIIVVTEKAERRGLSYWQQME